MKKLLRWFLGIVITLAILVILFIGPIDYTPLQDQPSYQRTMAELNAATVTHHGAKSRLLTSWIALNITPNVKMPMAGYAPRDHFDKVHDSIYVRILAIDNGGVRCFIISADLLLFPPALKEKITAKISDKKGFLYFTATHAHSSLGAWNDSVIGNLILGSYNEQWVDSLASKISIAIEGMSADMRPSSISYFEANADEYVENRLDPENGKTDGMLRGFKIIRDDKSRALLASYSAHPTNISHLSLELSGDYPNSLVAQAEHRGYDFAMFAAGMVGSHRAKGIDEIEFAFCDTLASRLYQKIERSKPQPLRDSLEISTAVFPIEYGPSQLHVLQQYKVRDWAFRSLFAPLEGEINYLKLGNIIMLGTPCDFSGEIFVRGELGKLAENKKEKLFITSFNGEYVGYITYDDHYGHSEQEEIMAMNWVGPFYGEYYTQIIKKILEKN